MFTKKNILCTVYILLLESLLKIFNSLNKVAVVWQLSNFYHWLVDLDKITKALQAI